MSEASQWRVPGYSEESELGRGGGGRVVVAVDQASGDRVAVKYLADRLLSDALFRAAFRSEAEILARLNLPHVARVRRYVESDDGAAIVMDLVTGVSLRQILARYGPAGSRAALSVLKGSLLGLAGAHQAGIVHRDYKPENVIVDASGSSMLVDFGIALRTGVAGSPAGTPGYAAPEQWTGAPASPAGDIYAAAVTFAECVSGTEPPRGVAEPFTPGPELRAEALGPRLASLIGRATDPDPATRPADAGALLAELQDAADDRFGAGWEDEGRKDLARAALALLAVAAGAAAGAATAGTSAAGEAGTAQGPTASAATVLRPARRAGRLRSFVAGHVPAVGIGAAAVVVAAGTAVAVTVATHHHSGRGGQAGQTAAASQGGQHHRHHTSPPPGRVSVNPADPCTWLTPADFAKYGISTGPLKAGNEAGVFRVCRSSSVRVGIRNSPAIIGCSVLPNCTNISIPGASAARYLVIAGYGREVDAYRGSVEYAVGVTSGSAGQAALVKLMELVLTRTAAAS